MKYLFHSPRWDEVCWWALDLETSGLDAARDAIVSVGMVPIRAGAIAWGDRYYTLVQGASRKQASSDAIGVHHIVPGDLTEAPPLASVLDEIERRIAGGFLLVHHAPLDIAFLRRAFRQSGRGWPKPRVVDTRLLVARLDARRQRLQPYAQPLPRGLSELSALFGLPPFDAHHALADALATAHLFLALRARLGLETVRQLRAR